MKRHQRIIILSILILTFILPQTGCGKEEPISDSEFLLNTICTITLYTPADTEILSEAFSLCKKYEAALSKTIADSDIGRINSAAGQPVEVSEETAQLIRRSIELGDLSGGLLDITVGKLTNLWDFTAEAPKVPPASDIAACLPSVNYKNISVDGNTVTLSDPNAQLDLGAIAKGYIADQIAAFLKEKGVSRAIIDLGGNIVTIGQKEDGKPWNIGIEKPFSETKEIIGNVPLSDASIVTSGIYERQFEEDGKLYHHILDPRTGYPVDDDLEAVSIISDSSTTCDGLSTICMLMGSERGKALIESLPDVEAIFIKKDGTILKTAGAVLN